MRYRIKIEEIENGKHKHIHNIMCETDNPKLLIKKIRTSIKKEINKRQELLIIHLNKHQKGMIQKIIDETPEDLIDFKSKGKDINKKEFLANEISLILIEE